MAFLMAPTDPLTAHPVQTFELRDLVTQTRLIGPVMRYVMLEVREQMTTTHRCFCSSMMRRLPGWPRKRSTGARRPCPRAQDDGRAGR